jgi:DNA-binding NarL/FixJ family response regulator
MRSAVAVPERADQREPVARRVGTDASALALRLSAPSTTAGRRIIPARPTTPARRAGAERMQIRVLVAEDHPLVREGVIRALERDPGIEVIGEADNGITAMELARQLKPDVMVLDLRMPGLGGAVVLERLRAELPETRALVMTANESPESLLDAVAAGAAGYLSKRTTGEELRQAVITTYGGGSVITPELAGHLLREFSCNARGEGSSVRPLLAERELEVLRLLADGLTDDEIGEQLYVSQRTVQNHLARVRAKTGLRRRPALARWAVAHGIASTPSTPVAGST